MIEMKDKPLKIICYCRIGNDREEEINTEEKKLQIKLNERLKKLYYPHKTNYFIPKLNFDGKRKSCL